MRKLHAHKQVAAVAKKMAEEFYEEVMRDNEVYAYWKSQCEELTPKIARGLFVELMAPKLLEPARATLARCLADPTLTHLHEAIYDALTKDYILAHGRKAAARERALLEVDEAGKVTSRKSPARPH